jgi:hypothetical protein
MSTPEQKAASDAIVLDGLLDLEGQIGDLACMSQIVSDMLCDNVCEFDPQTGQKTQVARKGECFVNVRLTENQIQLLMFAAENVSSRAIALKRQFYKAIDDGEVVQP